jgi:hypothetical protein
MRSPPRLELSGSEPSHEPQSRSLNSAEKATPLQRATEQAAITPAAKPSMSVDGDAKRDFDRSIRWRATAERNVGRRPGGGHNGKAGSAGAGDLKAAGRNGGNKALANENGGATVWTCGGHARRWRAWVITRCIGEIFFGHTCDRPGCYECFERTRRSPLQRFCSQECRRALERVLERERRWRKRGPARTAGAKSLATRFGARRL